MLSSGDLEPFARTAVIYHTDADDIEDVKAVAWEREPVNIEMHRHYDQAKMKELFGYALGAYSRSTKTKLMPNIAIYCQTPIFSSRGAMAHAHVINVIGYAFDTPDQPDYQYFFPTKYGFPLKYFFPRNAEKWTELVQRMSQMWTFVYECARRRKLRRVFLADVGGGAFSVELNRSRSTRYEKLKDESLTPVQRKYPDIITEKLPRVPDGLFERNQFEDSLCVNAWDPWSMVGNGNKADESLDGWFGRSTAMTVLCWPHTNPLLTYQVV